MTFVMSERESFQRNTFVYVDFTLKVAASVLVA